ncbi:MAG: mechanosensitive ion channel family protein, partial [Acidaminobacteraceae bacterium]
MNIDLGGINDIYNYFVYNWKDIVIALSIFLILFIFKTKISKLIIKLSSKVKFIRSKSTREQLEKVLLKPLNRLIIFIGIYLASGYLPFGQGVDLVMTKLFKSAIIITFASGIYQMESIYEGLFNSFEYKLNRNSSAMIKQVTVKLIRAVIIVLAVAIVASEFFDVNGFVAGLGIAGLAFAMAAQDTLGSLFAGLSIILDKPFDVGDWILCEGIEGTVEELSFKSTRIRTFSKELVSVPNQILANNPISNYSRRGMRRVNFKLGLMYSTTRMQMFEVSSRIEKILIDDDRIDNEYIIVRFDGFNSSSLDIFVNYYTKTIVYLEYLEIK